MAGRVLAALAVAAALMAVAFVARGTPARIELAGVFDDMNGTKVELASFKGKPVILNFWATWCGPCKLETPQLVGLSEKYRDRGFNIVGISVDDEAEAIRAFATEYKVPYPMLVGLGHEEFQERAGYRGLLPFTVLLKPDGTVAGQVTGIETTAGWEKRIEALLK